MCFWSWYQLTLQVPGQMDLYIERNNRGRLLWKLHIESLWSSYNFWEERSFNSFAHPTTANILPLNMAVVMKKKGKRSLSLQRINICLHTHPLRKIIKADSFLVFQKFITLCVIPQFSGVNFQFHSKRPLRTCNTLIMTVISQTWNHALDMSNSELNIAHKESETWVAQYDCHF